MINARNFIDAAGFMIACGGAVTSAQAAQPMSGKAPGPQERPNIVFVFADQFRFDAIGCEGNRQAITPRIDAFAAQSMDFRNAVAVSPVSAAYRASLYTGKYVSSTGFIINEICMNPNHDFLGEVLTRAGYRCGYVGKVHLNDTYHRPYLPGKERLGFEDYWACYTFNHMSYKGFYHADFPVDAEGNAIRDGLCEEARYGKVTMTDYPGQKPGTFVGEVDISGTYSPDIFTGLACDYIERAAAQDGPFALVLSWNPSHDPWKEFNCDPECYAKFKDTHFELPVNFNENVDQYMDRYPAEHLTREGWKKEYLKTGYEKNQRAYYAMVNSIDNEFGKVLDKLDELGIADNTIVVFTSDHGEMFTSQGRMYKLTFYNEAAHIPLLVRVPGGATGVSNACINTPDLMPTLLGLAGLHDAIPEGVEGKDLSFILRGKKGRLPEFAFLQGMGHTHLWQDGYEWRCVRDNKYCYARYLRDGKEILFDQANDPYQMHDLAADPAYAKVLRQYRRKMDNKLAELGDEFKSCTWYRDNWMYKNNSIKAGAHGEFGPLPPLEPIREK